MSRRHLVPLLLAATFAIANVPGHDGLAAQAPPKTQPVVLKGRAFNLFVQDDWRWRGNLTLNLGARYEAVRPYTEANGQMVNLDVAPDFTGAVPVMSGESGIYTGAFPAALMPTQIDRSVDDLAARIDKIESVEDALAFLQQLTPDDRQRLAESNTPLAAFADVRTPEEAMARLESLDVQHRMQLLAMFQRVEGH